MAAPTVTTGDLVSAADWNALPHGLLDRAEVTADQGGVGAETDLTGLTVTVTPASGRLIKITGEGEFRSTVAGDRLVLRIYEDASAVGGAVVYSPVASSSLGETAHGEAFVTGDGSSHTYKLTLERSVGSGTAGLVSSSTRPAFILVEDIGPA